jgi:NAD(P)-dependent dehydrogenase (short-subunit alcohol dehydrogenase family)
MSYVFDLTGKVAVVIGGSGGIGQKLAVALADFGADVVVSSRTLEKLEAVANEIRGLNRKALAIAADITDQASVSAMVDRVVKEFGHIDVLINAAGLTVRKTAEEISVAEWEKVLDNNARGTFICCQAVGRIMIKQRSGKIINVSSIRGRYGTAIGGVAYGPSKGAVDALTRTLALEWAQYNIYVNAIAPALVITELTKPLLSDANRVKVITAPIPIHRLAELDDLIGPVILLASNASNYMTGQIIYIDGGMSAGLV